jgi:lysophospholipase L1-like esterase
MTLSRRALLASPLLAAAGRLPAAAQPISRLDTPWWRQRHEAKLVELRNTQPGLIWLGDSITQNFEQDGPQAWAHFHPVWTRFYAPYRAVNLGFKGDATSHLLWRMEHGELDGITPKAAVILIGANNMGRVHWSAGDTLLGIDTVIATLRHRLPGTRPLLVSVLPSQRSQWVDETTVAINQGLAQRYGHVGDVVFHDVTSVFRPGGVLDRTLYLDGFLTPPDPLLHPTAAGMAKLAEAIAPSLAQLLHG